MRIALVLIAMTPGVRAQSSPTTGPATATQPERGDYWLRPTEEALLVRSRPDANSLPLARVGAKTVLHAFGAEYGWHRVTPPAGTFSYVSAAHVEQSSATAGIVSTDTGTLRVRVGSTVYDVDPSESDVQTRLSKGDAVQIVGRHGDWLKIAPPDGVWGYVRAAEVERLSADDAARLAAADAPTSQPALASSRLAVPPTQPTSAPASRPVEGPDLSGMWGQRLALVEAAIDAEGHRPAEEQQWGPLIERLQPIAAQHEEPMVARLAAAWVERLEVRIVEQDTARQAEDVLRKAQREHARHARELEHIRRAQDQPATAPAFAARGIFLRSLAVESRSGAPLYKLQNPLTRAVEAYIQLDPQTDANVATLMGQYVGVRGAPLADMLLGARYIRVSEIVVLQIDTPPSQPTRPEP